MKHGDRYRTTGTIGYEYDDTVIKKKFKIREENIKFYSSFFGLVVYEKQ